MLSLKETTIPKGLKPQTVLAIMVANEVFTEAGFHCVLTSLNDSKHGKNSYHYDGYAADIRVRNQNFPAKEYPDTADAALLAERIADRLGPTYDVIYGVANHYDHIHLEYNAREHE